MMTRNRFLVLVHRYNGWNVLFLLVSGVVLYLPALRAATAPIRVPLKWLHIASGVLMTAVLLAYLPALSGHWQRLGRRLGQRMNVILLVSVTLGWVGTGLVLTFYRRLPPDWVSVSLLWHDYLTWLIVPWLAIHSYTRYFKVKWRVPAWLSGARVPEPVPDRGRREFVTQAVAAVGAGAWSLYGWGALTGTFEPQTGAAANLEPAYGFVEPPHPVLQDPALAALTTAPTPAPIPAPITTTQAPSTPPTAAPASPTPAPTSPTQAPAPTPAAPATATATAVIFPDRQPPFTESDPPVPIAMKLPPTGGGRQGRFRIYTVTDGFPAFQPQSWNFFAQGLVERPLRLTWKEFLHLPRKEQVSDFHCVTGWSVNHVTWEGVKMRDLLETLGVKPEADHLKFFSHDGEYTDDLPLDVAMQDDIMLAYLMDGQPLPIQNGGPMRLIVPRMYAYKSVKWLAGLELIKGAYSGYWEVRGYPRNAWLPKT